MANKFFDFFNSLLNSGNPGSSGSGGDSLGLSADAIKSLKDELKSFNDVIDDNNENLTKLNKQYDNLLDQISDMSKKGKDLTEVLKERNKLENEHKKLLDLSTQAENEYKDFLTKTSKTLNTSVSDTEGKIKSLSSSTKQGTTNFASYKQVLGESSKKVIEHVKNLKTFSTAIEELGVAAVLAIEQFISLNDRLILFQRTSSGVLQARGLGFDVYGNNQTSNIGSLRSIAENNNISIEQFLKTFSAFTKEGQILGVTENLQQSQIALQNYGVSVGRISKLYGVSDETLAGLARNLSQNYGVKIKDLTSLFDDGAQKALQAGINVGKFFDNMNALSERIGDLFIRGGAKGIEDTAFALSKLGLSAASIDKINDSVKSFSDIINKQNQASALGLSNFAAAQARIFAKLQTGDSGGALRLQQLSLANDVQRQGFLDKNGNINTQGIASLKGAGLGKDEINSIQRLIRGAEFAGVSLEKYTDETKLSTIQLSKKRQFEEQNATFLEKLGMLYSQLKSIFIDPITSVLAPIADILINGLSVAFKLLFTVLKPIIFVFQILGNALTKVSNAFSFVTKTIEGFLDKIGLGSGKGADAMTKMVDILGTVLAVLIGISGIILSWRAISLAKQGIQGLGNLLGNIGGGKLSNLLGGLGSKALKGSLIGGAIGIGGDLLGGAIGGRVGGSISGASQGAGIGASIGSIIPGIGTLLGGIIGGVVGLVTANWDKISGWLEKIWNATVGWLSKIWKGILDFLPKTEDIAVGLAATNPMFAQIAESTAISAINSQAEKNNMDKMKIANVVSSLPDPSKIDAIMRTREVYNTNIIKAQEKQLQKTFQPTVNIKTSNDLFGGYKVKAAGY